MSNAGLCPTKMALVQLFRFTACLIGGCDIVIDLYKKGELVGLLAAADGIAG